VVVGASAPAKPYIHWLFLCASFQRKRLLRRVNRSEAVLARVRPLVIHRCLSLPVPVNDVRRVKANSGKTWARLLVKL
jgi:hypothetical protein